MLRIFWLFSDSSQKKMQLSLLIRKRRKKERFTLPLAVLNNSTLQNSKYWTSDHYSFLQNVDAKFSQVKTRAQNTPNSRQGEGLIAQRSFFILSPKREKTLNFKVFRTPCIDNWRHTAHTVEKRLLARVNAFWPWGGKLELTQSGLLHLTQLWAKKR